MQRAHTVIAIDGPAGSGKSTVAKALAVKLGLEYLDTGAMYRAVTFAALRAGLDPRDRDEVARVARAMQLDQTPDSVRVDGVDATAAIRGAEVSGAVSIVAANPGVREELRRRQRDWVAARGGGVLEGRDIGTVVFPDAVLKVYLTADPQVRATRRAQDVSDRDLAAVAANIAERDRLDSTRDDSPLREPEGALVLDTTDRTVDEIVDQLMELLA